jgi:hypothetical protein
MEVYQALSLMFMFGMFIIALLNYLKKKWTALVKGDGLFLPKPVPSLRP